MGDDQVVLVHDEHVPLPVNALGPVVGGQGGFPSLRFVPADGVADEELGVLGGRCFGRNGRQRVSGQPNGLVCSKSRIRLGQVRYGRLDGSFHIGLGQAGFGNRSHDLLQGRLDLGVADARLGHLSHGRLNRRFHFGAGQARGPRRRSGRGHLRAHNLLHFLAGQPRGGVRVAITACGQQDWDQQEQSSQRHSLELPVNHRASAFLLQFWCP